MRPLSCSCLQTWWCGAVDPDPATVISEVAVRNARFTSVGLGVEPSHSVAIPQTLF